MTTAFITGRIQNGILGTSASEPTGIRGGVVFKAKGGTKAAQEPFVLLGPATATASFLGGGLGSRTLHPNQTSLLELPLSRVTLLPKAQEGLILLLPPPSQHLPLQVKSSALPKVFWLVECLPSRHDCTPTLTTILEKRYHPTRGGGSRAQRGEGPLREPKTTNNLVYKTKLVNHTASPAQARKRI